MEIKFTKISEINDPSVKYIASNIDYNLGLGDEFFIFSNVLLSEFNILYVSVEFENVAIDATSTIELQRCATQNAPVQSDFIPVPGGILSIDTGAKVINDFNYSIFGWDRTALSFVNTAGTTTGALKNIIVLSKKQI